MNTKTARLIRKTASGDRHLYQQLKRDWNMSSRVKRTQLRKQYRRELGVK